MSTSLRGSAAIASLLVVTGMSVGCGKSHDQINQSGPSWLIVTSVSPSSGRMDVPTSVRITGKGFQPGATVTLDGAATNVNVVSDVLILATTPIHAAAAVDVVVTNPGGESARLPSGYRYTGVSLISFAEQGSGFQTTDLRDAQEQILQLNSAGELIWAADGTRLPGYQVESQVGVSFISGRICREFCVFEVRFGTRDGERRAYLTVDYGHDNPGTLVDVEVVAGALVVTQTSLYAPGSFTLSGTVTEMTTSGAVPVTGATVYRAVSAGWRMATTDSKGCYSLRGMYDSLDEVSISKSGYNRVSSQVLIKGDTRFDVQMVRVLPGGGLQ